MALTKAAMIQFTAPPRRREHREGRAVHRGGGRERREDRLPAGALQHDVLLLHGEPGVLEPGRADPRPDDRPHVRGREEHGIVLVAPIYEKAIKGELYNTAVVIGPDGQIMGKYRKTSIPLVKTASLIGNEKYYFKPGNLGFPVWQTPFGVNVGVMICYDRHFPEHARLLALNGADLVFVPTATGGMSRYLGDRAAGARDRQHLLRGRRQPGRLRRGRRDRAELLRRQLLHRPEGEDPRPGGEEKDGIVYAEIDTAMIEDLRNEWGFFRDRRPEMYAEPSHGPDLPGPRRHTMPHADRRRHRRHGRQHVRGRTSSSTADRSFRSARARRRGRRADRRRGQVRLPGAIDVHTHLDTPWGDKYVTADDWRVGSIGAACGGTTTIVDFALQAKGQSLREAIDGWHAKAEGKAVVDYGFHAMVMDLTDSVRNEIPRDDRAGGDPELQGLHGLQGRRAGRRRDPPAHDADRRRARRPDDGARRERRRRLRHPGALRRAGQARHRVLAAEPAAGARGRGRSPGDRARRDRERAALHRPRLERAGGRRDRAGAQRGGQVYGETCPQYLVLSKSATRARRGRCQVRDGPAAARRVEPGAALAGARVRVAPGRGHGPFRVADQGPQDQSLDDFRYIIQGAPGSRPGCPSSTRTASPPGA